jgi:radical SAM superfamily enzyme YgiQ (UPF0313 family)
MKIVLLHPRTLHEKNYSAYWLPYSILSVGSAVRHQGTVTLIDNNLHQSESHDAVRAACRDADLFGVSVMIGHQVKEAMDVASIVKADRPDLPVVVGGAMATMMPGELLTHPAFDYVVRGQGGVALSELLASLGRDERPVGSILGLNYRDGGAVRGTRDRPVLPQDTLAPYDFSLLDVSSYVRPDPKIAPRTINYVASQGCPFDCGFCSDTNLFGRRWSSSPAARIVKDVCLLVDRFGVDGIKFYDSNFFVRPALSLEYAGLMIERDLGLKWGGAIHPATFLTLGDEDLTVLERSGCSRMLIGAESGSEEVLRLVGKRLVPHDMVEIARRASRHRISVSFTMIIGFPGVAHSHYDETFALGQRLRTVDPRHEVKIHIYAPYPMTRLYPVAIAHGFEPPATLADWGNYDYYYIQTPWVPKEMEARAREFNVQHSSAVERV